MTKAAAYEARVTLRAYLDRHGLTPYRVMQAARGHIARDTVYALARGDVARLDLGSLAKLAGVLEHLTGQAVALGDLLTLTRAA